MRDVRKLTVAICTHNRDRLLRGALEALCAARPPERLEWEVLVVLNACHDDSAAVVESFRERLPIRSLSEPEPGVSKARNRAADGAAGDFILWIDDDVRVAEDWFRRYEAAILTWPDTSVFGGAIVACPEEPAAPWFDAVLSVVGPAFAHLPLDGFRDGAAMPPRSLPFGANFAIQTEVQRRYRYHPDLGKFPGKYIRNSEETSVLAHVLADGHEGLWLPSTRVEHVIPPARQTTSYLRAYYVGSGIMKGLKARAIGRSMAFSDLLADTARLLSAELRYRYARCLGRPRHWAKRLREASEARGRWLGKYGPRPYAVPSRMDFPI